MELDYLEDIKEDFINSYKVHSKTTELNGFLGWYIYDEDYYMTNEHPIENACYHLAIGAYLIKQKRIKEITIDKIVKEIKRSYEVINSGVYDKYFTKEDKKYIKEDLKIIEDSKIF